MLSVPVVHAATSVSGGAGIAAQRIRDAQRLCGVEASIIFRGSPRRPMQGSPGSELSLSRTDDARSRTITALNRMITRKPSVLFTPFSANPSLERLDRLADGSVLNLHNSYNMVDLSRLRQLSGPRTIFLTLHDERALTAGCHCTLGCDGPTRACRGCPQSKTPHLAPSLKAFSRQRQSLIGSQVHLVAPSRWMRDQALRFGWPGEFLHLIPNPINAGTFTPEVRDGPAAQVLASGRPTYRVGWLPGKVEATFWGGFRHFVAWMSRHEPETRVQVLTTSNAEVPNDVDALFSSPLTTDADRATFWGSCDVSVSVTLADNFPNVVLESIAVGTPICISDIGGATEAVLATSGGYVIEGESGEDVAEAMKRAFQSRHQRPAMMARARKSLVSLYGYDTIGPRYADVYGAVLGG